MNSFFANVIYHVFIWPGVGVLRLADWWRYERKNRRSLAASRPKEDSQQ